MKKPLNASDAPQTTCVSCKRIVGIVLNYEWLNIFPAHSMNNSLVIVGGLPGVGP